MELFREDSTDQLQVSVPLKSNRSPQFHVAVYYNNLEPITMETVKNKHGCYVYSGMYLYTFAVQYIDIKFRSCVPTSNYISISIPIFQD